ncbi:C-CAP/cofactor C-like domain-containing protein [Caenorhabditis elegans]|nr:C-CAP/cofactor C-like domain-containing protein [Caenorhabditis elegans]SOF58713.1 C-CAP/cofactor C-like domain-containing protein [Caenorhabditis elegans]|eukprot:NP_001343722.1 Uncharacterized protein CELE_C54G6.2 [Caenorhabditis elegans]
MYTKWIVLGAVRGIVIVKNCQSTRISVSCDQLIVLDSKNIEIYAMSPKKPIIFNSSAVTFAPFNTIYEGQMEFLEENGHGLEHNLVLKEPINFGDGSWKLMETSRFVCQHTPLHTSDKQFEMLLNSLPEEYRVAHHRNAQDAQKMISLDPEKCRLTDVTSNFDLLFLKSKIEKIHVEA